MPHATASFNGKVIAETDTWENVDGNIYVRIGECGLMLDVDADNRKFPPNSIDQSVLTKTDTHTSCPWKGKAHYYSISVDGKEEPDSAWYYPEPLEKAKHIKDHVAFYGNKVDIKSD